MRSLEDDVLDLLITEFREDLTAAQIKYIADQLQRRRDREIERLRAALREVISDYEAYEANGSMGYTVPKHDPEIVRRAREALGQE